jgi:isopenicillin-N N-acyltransferase-like protein
VAFLVDDMAKQASHRIPETSSISRFVRERFILAGGVLSHRDLPMRRKGGLPVVDVSGSYYDMGLELGRQCRRIAQSMLAQAKIDLSRKGIPWSQAITIGQDYLPSAKEFDSKYMELLRGYSVGSELRFEEIFTMLCRDERGLCTDVMVNGHATSDGSVLSAHTEDWLSSDEKHVVLVHGRPRGDPSFLIMSIGGFELVGGLNAAGISFSGNSLSQNDMRIGIPKMFLARRIAASRTIAQAITATVPADRGSSYNNNICHSSGEMYCVEASATDFSLLYSHDGFLVHTNHYLDPRMSRYEMLFQGRNGRHLGEGSGSLVRYHRALRLVKKELGNINVKYLAAILSDHVNRPNSICNHVDSSLPPGERYKTLYATIVDLTSLEMMVCFGNPCKGKFEKYSLA